jgi:hypothetical protein
VHSDAVRPVLLALSKEQKNLGNPRVAQDEEREQAEDGQQPSLDLSWFDEVIKDRLAYAAVPNPNLHIVSLLMPRRLTSAMNVVVDTLESQEKEI